MTCVFTCCQQLFVLFQTCSQKGVLSLLSHKLLSNVLNAFKNGGNPFGYRPVLHIATAFDFYEAHACACREFIEVLNVVHSFCICESGRQVERCVI